MGSSYVGVFSLTFVLNLRKHKVVESTFTPKNNENQELEAICKNLSETKINIKRTSDNIPNLRDGLNSLMTKIRSNEIIIKPADKGSIVVVMSSNAYLKMILH